MGKGTDKEVRVAFDMRNCYLFARNESKFIESIRTGVTGTDSCKEAEGEVRKSCSFIE